MSAWRNALTYLGVAQSEVEAGFVAPDRRAGQFSVCATCGSLVALDSQGLHARWHRDSPRR